MPDFKAIVAGVKEQHEARVREEEAKQARERAESGLRTTTGIEWLQANVVPLLQDAKAACQAQTFRFRFTRLRGRPFAPAAKRLFSMFWPGASKRGGGVSRISIGLGSILLRGQHF